MRFSPLAWLLATLGPTLTVFAIAARRGWPGVPLDCADSCFCEVARDGWLRQPANTLSNLVPIALAFVVAVRATRRPSTTRAGAAFERAFPVALAFQGTGSMFFHASLVEWGGRLDSLSMLVMMGLLLSANLVRFRNPKGERPPILGTWLAIAAFGVGLSSIASGAIPLVMFAMLITNLSLEVVMSRRHRGDERWLRVGLAVFVAANVVWALSAAPGQPLCEPSSWLQGHAIWHAGAGVAVFILGVHFARALEAPRFA